MTHSLDHGNILQFMSIHSCEQAGTLLAED